MIGLHNDYGIFLIELITGKSARLFQKKKGLSLIDWAIPYLENGSLNQVMDPRLMEMSSDSEVVNHIAPAALLCLNNNDGAHKFSISEVLQACVDLKLGSSLLDFECHFNETIEKKM